MGKNILIFLALAISLPSFSQKREKKAAIRSSYAYDSVLYSKLQYRLVGPFRGGRSAAVTGDLQQKNVFYMGSTGGGVWKTQDGGSNWKNISDGYFGGSIGSVAVAPSDPLTIYAGTGENTLRGNVSEGDGMWKSADGGRTWKNIGLKDSRHITRIVIHPRNPDIVWAACTGHLFGPNEERGVYKTTDGGKTWKRVLFANSQAGAIDLVMDPTDPNILYASTWRVIRTPYSLESGGAGSALWKSTDGGETWKNISRNKGLPKDTLGIIGITVCRSNPERLYAMIEAKDGGLFRSDDAGNTWTKTSTDANITQRAWYFYKVFADPADENTVYVLNVGFYRSKDGGKTFQSVSTPHGDHHDLWIDPHDPKRMIIADDGGAQISFDGGDNWSTYYNQPTAQFYRVTTDNHFPYRILGAQQDNTTVRILSRTYGGEIAQNDWQPTAGFESGYVVADPLNPDIVYGGNYDGYLARLDHKTGENRAVSVWPESAVGSAADTLKYRFQWNFPIFFSPNDPHRLYCAANVLFKTDDEGQSWQEISPDLTTDDKSRQVASGGPITKDNTSVEYYCTIFTATESWLEKDLLWAGSDDGLLHLSRNGGKNWENVTPAGMPKWMMFNSIEVNPFKKGGAYVVGTRYKLDDYTPYIYKTEDYGRTWKLITNGIPRDHFARVVRADLKRPGLLYCGTERGMYISFDDGEHWEPFQQNLPIVPVTDLTIKDNDLVVATQGRAFWVLDDLGPLQQMNKDITGKDLFVFQPRPAYRIGGFSSKDVKNAGMNPPNGVVFNYYGKNFTDSTKLSVSLYDSRDSLIKTFSTTADDKDKDAKMEIGKGMNQFVWDMRYPPAEKIDGMILWNGNPGGPKAPPGNYKAVFKTGKDSSAVPFEIIADPNYKISTADYDAQFNFLIRVRDKFSETVKAIKQIRDIRTQMNELTGRLGKDCPKAIKDSAAAIDKKLTLVEEALYQTKAKSGEDVLNYPIRLNDKLAGVYNTANSGYTAPSKQARDVFQELSMQVNAQLNKLKQIIRTNVGSFNRLVRDKDVPAVIVK